MQRFIIIQYCHHFNIYIPNARPQAQVVGDEMPLFIHRLLFGMVKAIQQLAVLALLTSFEAAAACQASLLVSKCLGRGDTDD